MNINFPTQALDRLRRAGFEACYVGGCVRDALLGRPAEDLDVATSASPEQVEAVFSDCRVIETGLRHGTVTVLLEGRGLEITTFRREEGYSDGRHPDRVVYTDSLAEDLSRRDFTVNAMAWSPEKGLVDLFGGRADLERGVLRCVGDPYRRFAEDALRILRGLRFSAVLGFSLEENTARAARDLRQSLNRVSFERIRTELLKLLCGGDCRRVLLEYPEILAVPIPELWPMVGFDQRNPHHCYDVWTHSVLVTAAVPPEPGLRLAALLHDVGKPACFTLDENGVGHFYGHGEAGEALAREITARLRLDKATRDRVICLVRHHDRPILPPEEKTVKRCLNRFGRDLFFELMALKRADNLAQHPDFRGRIAQYEQIEAMARRILEAKEPFRLKDLAVNGRDLIALGYAPGPALGAALDGLLRAVMEGSLPNEREALLNSLKNR